MIEPYEVIPRSHSIQGVSDQINVGGGFKSKSAGNNKKGLYQEAILAWGSMIRGRILVQVTIYRRLLIGRDGHLDQSEAYDIS